MTAGQSNPMNLPGDLPGLPPIPAPEDRAPMLTALRIVVERAAAESEMQRRRIADLIEANNRYLQEARDARAELKAAREEMAAMTAAPVPVLPFTGEDPQIAFRASEGAGEPPGDLADWQRGILAFFRVKDMPEARRPYHGLIKPRSGGKTELGAEQLAEWRRVLAAREGILDRPVPPSGRIWPAPFNWKRHVVICAGLALVAGGIAAAWTFNLMGAF